MTSFDNWLLEATRHLSKDSAAQVRTEIQQHYESAREAAVGAGASADEAARSALNALGDARAANQQYRQVLLTSAEARMLGNARWESRAFCSSAWLKWLFRIIPIAALVGAVKLVLSGDFPMAGAVFLMGFLMASPFVPVYTPARARIFRFVRWVLMVGALGLAFGSHAREWSWLLFSCLWPMFWMEWTRASIRRKLPSSKWPKALYI